MAKSTSPAAAALPENHFKYEGKTYQVLDSFKKVNIPGVGVLTAAEILASGEAQEHLVEQKCFNLISEVIA